ncbi:MAG TPA: hypothetical protein PLX18_11360 [Anaerohalosphaeraceae bacterium]|nr:hypothetical protein [Anaerohalosphaeraceae bacterium]HQG06868.1 hypothetical protein [Anaerohalosphaeraceae bacterium]HQI08439.1 hypothetical protein [Anaerohalosphaeraceae bacterium]HQJ68758.1 hypothetical protein [Anaerohalosphaeraceae bacterium]
MRILIELGPEFRAAVSGTERSAKYLASAASAGLRRAAEETASYIADQYLSGRALNRRTGNLARSLAGWMIADLEAVIGVRPFSGVDAYAWLLTDEVKTIRPRTARLLAVPIGENLTAAGVPRFRSPRDVPNGFFYRSASGALLFGYRLGKTERARIRPLFALVPEVTVFGSGALYDGVLDRVDAITDTVYRSIADQLESA